ncbi:MAG: ABC transporter permease, partial [Spirochaetes bacterium]|nr:ABC transporter permease [Spirochaetota bacterium]
GRELKAGDFDKAVVGGTLADQLKLDLGSSITLTTIDSEGYQNACFLRIKGIISSFSEAFDSVLVKTPLPVVKELVNISGVQEIVVLLNKTKNTDPFVIRLKKMIAKHGWNVQVRTWYQSSGYYQKVVRYYSGYFNIILFIIVIIAFFTTLNTMLMSVFERITEFGTMRSFGMPGRRITRIMLLEGMFIAVIGIALGVLVSFAITKVININGIYVAAPPGATTGFRAFILLKGKNFVIAVLMALFVSFTSSIIAAGKIRKMSVIRQILYNDLQ